MWKLLKTWRLKKKQWCSLSWTSSGETEENLRLNCHFCRFRCYLSTRKLLHTRHWNLSTCKLLHTRQCNMSTRKLLYTRHWILSTLTLLHTHTLEPVHTQVTAHASLEPVHTQVTAHTSIQHVHTQVTAHTHWNLSTRKLLHTRHWSLSTRKFLHVEFKYDAPPSELCRVQWHRHNFSAKVGVRLVCYCVITTQLIMGIPLPILIYILNWTSI